MAERRRRVRRRRRRPVAKFSRSMRSKLLLLFGGFLACFCGLIVRLMYIEYTSGDRYQKIVLAQQSYDSSIIPFQRGDIVDTNGTILATSVAVYNVVLDVYQMTSKEEYVEPTIDALVECFPEMKRKTLQKYASEEKDNRYLVLAKKLPYDEIQDFVEMQDAVDKDGNKQNPNISGVWFEKEYQRSYPYNSLASSVIGFMSDGNVGTSGLENYYDGVLNGTNGREYGYLNSDSAFEKTVIEPENGKTLVTSIDANIQSIVETKIKEFNEIYANNERTGAGSSNTAVIVMNPNTGEIMAMADYPTFDCNDARNLDAFYTKEQQEELTDQQLSDFLNKLWQNYCVSATYEPGSVQKPLTVACGIETGTLDTDMTFVCDGYEKVSGHTIHCVNRSGHGTETLEKSLMDSCNDALMQMSYRIGEHHFSTYQSIFGFGKKTGIDLPGEAYTASLIRGEDEMNKSDLATYVFGQNFNCTMVQMVSAFSSLINGGTYYQPHVVRKITDSGGNTVSTVEPTAVKQTVSKSTSDLLKKYLKSVVDQGTGNTAKVDGYSMGGKTGTAQKSSGGSKDEDNYLVSFMGFAPYENPQVVIYCIIDEPNVKDQAHSSYAQNIVREIMEEMLPYLNIYEDEEKTGVNENLDITGQNPPSSGGNTDSDATGNVPEGSMAAPVEGGNGTDTAQGAQDAQDAQDGDSPGAEDASDDREDSGGEEPVGDDTGEDDPEGEAT